VAFIPPITPLTGARSFRPASQSRAFHVASSSAESIGSARRRLSAATTGAASDAASRSGRHCDSDVGGNLASDGTGLVTLRPRPTATQPFAAPHRPSQRIPPTLASSTITSLGHLRRAGGNPPSESRQCRYGETSADAQQLRHIRLAPPQHAQPQSPRRGHPTPPADCLGPHAASPPPPPCPAGAPASASRCRSSCVDAESRSRTSAGVTQRATRGTGSAHRLPADTTRTGTKLRWRQT